MSSDIAVSFSSNWSSASAWAGALTFTMTNNTGQTLTNPEIRFQLGQNCSVLENTGFEFNQQDDVITGHLKPYLNVLPNGATVHFSVGASFPDGTNQHALPVAYWVNGKKASGADGKPDQSAPTTPSGLKSFSVTSDSIGLSWEPSMDNTRVDHYVVTCKSPGSTGISKTVTGIKVTISGLTAATTYALTVSAVDTAGNASKPSNTLTVTTGSATNDNAPPSVPSGLKASDITNNSTELSWNAATDNVAVTGYKVKYTTSAGDTNILSTTGTSCLIKGLKAATEYSCSIAACDAGNNVSDYCAVVKIKTLSSASSIIGFAPYLDVTLNANWSTPVPTINTRYVSEALDLNVRKFHLAFLVQDSATKKLVWGNSAFPYNAIKPLSDKINQAGGEVIIAFGGANGTDPSVSHTKEALSDIYVNLNKDFNVRHIDFDFETAGQYDYKVAFPAALAAQEKSPELWFSLTLPVLPSGLVTEGIEMLKYAKMIGLNINIQIMAMDYGSSGIDMGDAAVSAIEGTKKNLAGIYPDKSEAELYKLIGVITMIGQNDTAGEMFTFQDAVQTAQYAKQKGLNLVSFWSLTRDFPGMGDLATCSKNPEQTKDYEYTSTFLAALK